MNDLELAERADAQLAESLRDEAEHVAGGVVADDGRVLLCRGAGELPYPPNKAMLVGDLEPAEALRRATDFFRPHRAGYSFVLRLGTRDDGLAEEARRWRPVAELASAAMVVTRPLGAGPPLGPGVALRTVTDAAGAADYAAVVDESYQSLGWLPGGPADLFADPGLLLQARKAVVVATVDGAPAAVAYVRVTDGLGLVSWVGTTTAARGRGLGEAVTRWVTDAAFERGAEAAWLTASTMGEPLYRRLGYRTFGQSRSVILWPSLEGHEPPD